MVISCVYYKCIYNLEKKEKNIYEVICNIIIWFFWYDRINVCNKSVVFECLKGLLF